MNQIENVQNAAFSALPSLPQIKKFLMDEGYDFDSSHERLDERLMAICDDVQTRRLEKAWATKNEKLRLERLYEFPKTLLQAHLTFSHDRSRIIHSFKWLLDSIPVGTKAIADVGCGTGSLVRLIAKYRPEISILGIDRATNLIAAARTANNSTNVRFETMDMAKLFEFGTFDLIVSACGIDQPYLPEPSFEDVVMTQGKGIMPGYRRTVATAYGPILSGLRKAASENAQLFGVFRIPTQTLFLTFADVAAEIGWRLNGASSMKLRVENETFPAAVFTASAPGANVDVRSVASFY